MTEQRPWPISGSSGYTPSQLLGGDEPEPEPVMQENTNGTWTPSVPTGLSDDLDFEVTGTGPFRWEAWRGMTEVVTGSARTRLGLQIALLRARRKHGR